MPGSIERFLSQPFFVAEVFTGFPGIYTPLEETIDSFERLCAGEGDDLPESAFMYVGTLDDARKKARRPRRRPAPEPGPLR